MINTKFELFPLGSIYILGQKSVQPQGLVSCKVIQAVIWQREGPLSLWKCISANICLFHAKHILGI